MPFQLPKIARLLGLWGLAPQIFFLATGFVDPELKWTMVALGFGYAVLIFSFLGGIWWGLALRQQEVPAWAYVLSISPSLIGLVSYAPWIFGWTWPGPSLILLGLCLTLSPWVDQRLEKYVALPKGWLGLRWTLSLGLGGLTVILALI
jgi:Protein of unknown function (DUF3429)